MNNRKSLLSVFILCTALLVMIASLGFAVAIQDRMKTRIPEITKLKSAGIVGENNQGFLAYLGDKKDNQKLVNAENADRKKVYQAIAKKTKGDAVVVGQRRAAQLASKGVKGHWYQDAGGKWSQK